MNDGRVGRLGTDLWALTLVTSLLSACGSDGGAATGCREVPACGPLPLPNLAGRGESQGAAVRDGLVYVLGAGGLEVIDVRDPAAPLIAGLNERRYDEEAFEGLIVDGDYAYYLARYRMTAGQDLNFRLHTVDVSNPARPVGRGSVDVTEDASTRLLHVSQGFAYISADTASSDPGADLLVVDVRSPRSPRVVARVPTSNTTSYVEDAVRVGDTLYAVVWGDVGGVSETEITFRLLAFDVSSTESPVERNGVTIGPVPGRISPHSRIAVLNDHTLAVTAVASGGSHPTMTGQVTVAARVDIRDPGTPRIDAMESFPGLIAYALVAADDGLLYVEDDAQVVTLDMLAPTPTQVGSPVAGAPQANDGSAFAGSQGRVWRVNGNELEEYDLPDNATGSVRSTPLRRRPLDRTVAVAYEAGHVFVADGTGGLRIFRPCTSAVPLQVGGIFEDQMITSIAVDSGLAVAFDDGAGLLRVVNVADPTLPVELGAVAGQADDVVAVVNGLLLVGRAEELLVFDIRNGVPSAPTGVLPLPGFFQGQSQIATDAGRVYVSSRSPETLIEVDVSSPSAPSLASTFDHASDGVRLSDGWAIFRAQTGAWTLVPLERLDELPGVLSESPSFLSGNVLAIDRVSSRALVNSDDTLTLRSLNTPQSTLESWPMPDVWGFASVTGPSVAFMPMRELLFERVGMACGR